MLNNLLNKFSKPKKSTKKISNNSRNRGKPTPVQKNQQVKKPTPNKSQLKDSSREVTVPSNANVVGKSNIKREFQYTKPVNYQEKQNVVEDVVIETVTDERLISKRPVLETVTDLNEVSLFQKISLVNYFNMKESGKIDERIAREEYRRNTEILKRETSLLYFLRESARRQLEYNEVKGYKQIDIRIDPKYSLEDIEKCIQSKLLASYHIEIIHNNDLLSKMGVDPIIIRMSLKKI